MIEHVRAGRLAVDREVVPLDDVGGAWERQAASPGREARGGGGAGGLSGALVGRAVPRREDERILRGATRYLDDIDPPGAAHVAFVRSPLAHARIGGIEIPGGLEGVVRVITAADLEDHARDLPVQSVEGASVSEDGHPVLARGEVRYSGQPVVAVLAESRALAEDAAESIVVDYEPLDPVLDVRASEVRMSHWHRVSGDVEGAFASAARVVRASHVLPRLAPVPMEPRGAIASYDEADDLLSVWVSAQDSHRQLAGLATVLDRPEESIPMAPVGAQGITALADASGAKETWRWRVFSFGAMLGMVFAGGIPGIAGRLRRVPARADQHLPAALEGPDQQHRDLPARVSRSCSASTWAWCSRA